MPTGDALQARPGHCCAASGPEDDLPWHLTTASCATAARPSAWRLGNGIYLVPEPSDSAEGFVRYFYAMRRLKTEPTASRTIELPVSVITSIEGFVHRHGGAGTTFDTYVASILARHAQEIARIEGSRPDYGDHSRQVAESKRPRSWSSGY